MADPTRELLAKSKAFLQAAQDELDRVMPAQDRGKCVSDPCPFCTAAIELEVAMMHAEDALDKEES